MKCGVKLRFAGKLSTSILGNWISPYMFLPLGYRCSVEDMQRFRKRQFQVCPPSESYFAVILKGLLEHGTLSEEQSKAYIASKSEGLPEDANVDQI